jgi:hypothetical protein
MGEKVNGRRYGMLVILHTEKVKLKSASRNTYYRCVCDCGKETVVAASNLYQGRTQSCGCNNYKEQGEKRRKNITYQGKEMWIKDFAKLTGNNPTYVYHLIRQGKTPEEIISGKGKGLRQRVAEKYGKTRQWVSIKLKEGKTIEEKNGEVELV